MMADWFKFAGIGGTADYIAAAGFPLPLFLAWVAAIFELLLILGFLSGAFFAETALLAALYLLFLGFSFHGPSHWQGDLGQFEFGSSSTTSASSRGSSSPRPSGRGGGR